MEFKGVERAEDYCNSIEERNPYEDFLNGYNQALQDTKAPEMLEMLQRISDRKTITFDDLIAINKLIKQATEL